jgi:hypothetical protein
MNVEKPTSWVIVSRETGVGVYEFFNEALIAKVNTDKYHVMPILEYLYHINIKQETT